MHVLITGGTGLIGTALTHKLLREHHSVTIISRNPSSHIAPPGALMAEWDGKTTAGWGGLVNEADAIVNLAGVNLGGWLWTPKRREKLRASRLNAGAAVTKAIQEAHNKPEVLLQASAVGYYAPAGAEIITETSTPGSDFQSTLVKEWEKSTTAVEDLGVRRVVFRSGVVFKRGAFILNMFLLPFKMMVGGPIGSGKQYLSWLHYHDEIEGLYFLLNQKSAKGVFNLMSPQPVANHELGHAISRVLKRPYWFPVPSFALQMALGELSTVVLNSWRGFPSRLTEMGFKFKYPEVETALTEIVQN